MRSEQVEIPVVVRSEVGKIASRHLRLSGQIPAVLYGRGAEPIPLAVDRVVFAKALSPSAWYHTLVSLKVEGSEGGEDRPTVMIAEVQRDLIERRVISVDFRRISLSEKIHTHVPVRHVGESPGMKKGGILDQVTHELMVECLPTEMPDHLEVDITGLEIGGSVRVRDIVAVPGVRILAAEDDAVIVIAAPVRAEEVAPAPAGEGALVEDVPLPEVVGESEES